MTIQVGSRGHALAGQCCSQTSKAAHEALPGMTGSEHSLPPKRVAHSCVQGTIHCGRYMKRDSPGLEPHAAAGCVAANGCIVT